MYCLLNILYCFYFSLFFFQQPLSSLGRPRILVGLLYSSSQEIEVDARHYKQNTSNQSSQGFLHIHLFRGRDLPQGKPGSTETFSKWYATRSALLKKKTLCWYSFLYSIGCPVGKLLTQQGRKESVVKCRLFSQAPIPKKQVTSHTPVYISLKEDPSNTLKASLLLREKSHWQIWACCTRPNNGLNC